MAGHTFSFGLNLISLLLGQFEKAVRDSYVANPDSFHVNCAIQGAKPPESTFNKVHRTTRPVIGLADSQSQKAHSQNRCRPFVPSSAVAPSNAPEPGERNVQRKADHTRGGITVPAGGKYRSPSSAPSWANLSESNALPRISP